MEERCTAGELAAAGIMIYPSDKDKAMAKKKTTARSRPVPGAPAETVDAAVSLGLPPGATASCAAAADSDGLVGHAPGALDVVCVDPPPIKRLDVPLVDDAGDGHISRHVQIGALTRVQKTAQGRLRLGLIASGKRLLNGLPVRSNADAWRWVLEQLAAGGNGK